MEQAAVSPRAMGHWVLLAALIPLSPLPALAVDPPERWQQGDPIPAELAAEIDQLIRDLGDVRRPWLTIDRVAVHRLAEIGPPAIAPLEDAVLLAEPAVRRLIITMLSRIARDEPSPILEAGLSLSLVDAVDDLRHDAVRWNAVYAIGFLREHTRAAQPLLEAALDSPDHQQRQMAAALLHRLTGNRPTPRMIEVTVEGLRDDVLPRGRRPGESRVTMTGVFNAANGVRWFLRDQARIRAAEPRLLVVLSSSDHQQRFLAAYLLGRVGCTEAPHEVFRVLVPHLADNDIRGDANMAAAGLYGLGPAIVPAVRARLRRADAQEELLLRLLIHNLAGPDDPDAAVPSRARRRKITDRVHDPVVEHRFLTVPKHLDSMGES